MPKDKKAYYLYLSHHEGPGNGSSYLRGAYTDAAASTVISQNIVPKSHADELIKKAGGNKSAAYMKWLDEYITNHIVPRDFRQ